MHDKIILKEAIILSWVHGMQFNVSAMITDHVTLLAVFLLSSGSKGPQSNHC